MRTYDWVEICELVGISLLNKVSDLINKNNVRLYRDDGLTVFKNKSGQQLEKMKNNLQKLLKDFALKVIIENNLKIVNYLDVTLNLKDGTY